ncbi:TIGR00282 family metallophosphoesterase [Candidatus Poribacteria bacterium]|nr:TIGR00282 family metallophosphoesterase [Candidatus Poribacteria bacterium]
MNVLFIGDVIGGVGRKALSYALPILKKKYKIDITIVNGENSAGGFGINPAVANTLYLMGVDIITSGNHIWDKKEVNEIISTDRNLLRPANYPSSVPGRGSGIYEINRCKIGVINMSGRTFMANLDCPFKTADKEIENIKKITPNIILDMHAEATSEKIALAWYLDGRVSSIVGTHTHVQTADERILPGGTAFITDVGMTGSMDSVIGIRKEQAIERFLTQIPIKFEAAKENVWVCGVYISIDKDNGKAKSIERIQFKVEG